jgi:hypothetical protein
MGVNLGNLGNIQYIVIVKIFRIGKLGDKTESAFAKAMADKIGLKLSGERG